MRIAAAAVCVLGASLPHRTQGLSYLESLSAKQTPSPFKVTPPVKSTSAAPSVDTRNGKPSGSYLDVISGSRNGVAAASSNRPTMMDDIETVVRAEYDAWLRRHGKQPDESRYPNFRRNYLMQEEYAKKTGKFFGLNEYADLTDEEYREVMQTDFINGSANGLPNGSVINGADAGFANSVNGSVINGSGASSTVNGAVTSHSPFPNLSESEQNEAPASQEHPDYDEILLRSEYNAWLERHGKQADEKRYVNFKKNFIEQEEYGKRTGKYYYLNEYGDCSEEEYLMIAQKSGNGKSHSSTSTSAPTPVDVQETDPLQEEESRIRSEYASWLKRFGKLPDESRYPNFKKNFLTQEEYGKRTGKRHNLNEFGDCSKEEFEELQSTGSSAVTPGQQKHTSSQVNGADASAAYDAQTATGSYLDSVQSASSIPSRSGTKSYLGSVSSPTPSASSGAGMGSYLDSIGTASFSADYATTSASSASATRENEVSYSASVSTSLGQSPSPASNSQGEAVFSSRSVSLGGSSGEGGMSSYLDAIGSSKAASSASQDYSGTGTGGMGSRLDAVSTTASPSIASPPGGSAASSYLDSMSTRSNSSQSRNGGGMGSYLDSISAASSVSENGNGASSYLNSAPTPSQLSEGTPYGNDKSTSFGSGSNTASSKTNPSGNGMSAHEDTAPLASNTFSSSNEIDPSVNSNGSTQPSETPTAIDEVSIDSDIASYLEFVSSSQQEQSPPISPDDSATNAGGTSESIENNSQNESKTIAVRREQTGYSFPGAQQEKPAFSFGFSQSDQSSAAVAEQVDSRLTKTQAKVLGFIAATFLGGSALLNSIPERSFAPRVAVPRTPKPTFLTDSKAYQSEAPLFFFADDISEDEVSVA